MQADTKIPTDACVEGAWCADHFAALRPAEHLDQFKAKLGAEMLDDVLLAQPYLEAF